MATRKTYNSTDCSDQLLLVEREEGDFGGFDPNLLVDSLSPLEVQLLICTKCNGIMNDACQVGQDQLHMCEKCMEEGEDFQPMKLSRNSIPGLKAKCPLITRGCLWDGTLAEVQGHLDSCPEFVIHCPDQCEAIFKRSELDNHKRECQLLRVNCEYCGMEVKYRELESHYEDCQDIQIECPNECLSNLKRREIEVHLRTDCPNSIVNCPFMKFGCQDEFKRCELGEHQRENESKHTQLQLTFALSKIETLEQDRMSIEKQYCQDVAGLKQKLENQEVTISTLEDEKEHLKSKIQGDNNSVLSKTNSDSELNFDIKLLDSPSTQSVFPAQNDLTNLIAIKNIGSTIAYKNAIATNEKVVIHFFDNSSVSPGISSQYREVAAQYSNIKFCQANVSNDRGISKLSGVKVTHLFQFYHNGEKMTEMRWKEQESFKTALENLSES